MNRLLTGRSAGLLLLVLLLLAGCRRARPVEVVQEKPRPLSLMIVGATNLNSAGSQGGQAQSARIRIYELTSETNFKTVTLETFWRDDEAALGKELVRSRQIVLFPDSVEVVEIEPRDETQYIGVAANLRLPDPQQWRRVYPVGALRGQQVRIQVGADRIEVNVP